MEVEELKTGIVEVFLWLFTEIFLEQIIFEALLMDDLYHSVYNLILVCRSKRSERQHLIAPDPSLFTHEEIKATLNMILYQYFLICARL